ncbi:NACHT domain-containing protein [Streptomyces sp. NBC_01142]|uniref:NACHT domain-containing protein n=1 Tax=Streptomyces sp. NBC_01142 TaxID=2975865 RepID=UPI00225B0DCB|nr:NACHT domain-containing protein [Streptomyces sp. NBC_01142]MCX4826124.1 NACHT domain-containing protein [Streptomyces sp. NBC_01142]
MGERLKWVGIFLAAPAFLGLIAYLVAVGLEDADKTASVIGLFVGMAGLALALRGIALEQRNARMEQEDPPIDRLADAVRDKWRDERKLRRVTAPFELSVAWKATDPRLVEPLPELEALARGWGADNAAAAHWASDPAALAGSGGEIVDVFTHRVPTSRLVVLGEPGSGKSTLLMRLLLVLLGQREAGDRVPVIFSIASWDPNAQGLKAWMADQLVRDHTFLGLPDQAEPSRPRTRARALLDRNKILPILDGFDELLEALQPQALHAISQEVEDGQPVVLSSRTAEYATAVTSSTTRVAVPLTGAAGISLLPLDPGPATDYLKQDLGGEHIPAAARWNAVLPLASGSPLERALSTPLGLFLARTIYNPRPHEAPTSLPNPRELLGFHSRQAVMVHLFDAYVPAAYRTNKEQPCRWRTEKAQRALKFLAHHIEHHVGGSDIAWWELRKALSPRLLLLMLSLVAGLAVSTAVTLVTLLAFGLWAATSFGLQAGVELGLLTVSSGIGLFAGLTAAGLVTVVAVRVGETEPSVGIRWSWHRFAAGRRGRLQFAIAGGVCLLAVQNGLESGWWAAAEGALTATLFGTLAWVLVFLLMGFEEVPSDQNTAVGPANVLGRDRRTFRTASLVSMLLGGGAVGVGVGIPTGLSDGLGAGLAFGCCVGLWAGLMSASTVGLNATAWAPFAVTKMLLAVKGDVPRDLMAFLADAHQFRGVLRQSGAVYQFRHQDLQRHLARDG